jgi:hypothetical protein
MMTIQVRRTFGQDQDVSDFEDSEVLENDLIDLVPRDLGLEYIPKRAIRVQKYYMR